MLRPPTAALLVIGLSCLASAGVDSLSAQASASTATATSGYDHGFFLRSADERHQLTIEALLQVNGRFFEAGLPDRNSEFFLRRFRLELAGHVHRVYRFRIEPNFTEDGVALNEAWIGLQREDSETRLILGRMKEPFSMEEMGSLRRLDFIEKSILNQFIPAEDHGITLLGRAFDRQLEWGLAFYNGTGGDDLNSDKDAAARLVLHPTAAFQIGGAATFGRARQDVGGKELRTETRVPFTAFNPNSRIDGDVLRLGAEMAWFLGPASLKAEYLALEQDMVGTTAAPISLRGYYVSATWLLTGEAKSWGTVVPATPFLLEDPRPGQAGGSGAFELVARFSELDLDDDLVNLGLLPMATFPGRVRTFDLGLNWFLSTHSRVLMHYVHTDYADWITRSGRMRSGEDALLVQFQLNF